ncbi:LysR family transcriptional regulator [Ideonella sp. A 288]|uniref:LysR family transcriptional regulator n=1 Tax=Ideonella sp. A 288 TaxID=1962181 RepID=UPI000B4A8DBA|nr:LysR family transcriptional regulator [Ideonella sp. A 288]
MIARPTNFRTLDLNLLKVFDAVMVERNVTRAADHLAMTQPAVSNALRRLREATHEDLFVPTSTGVVPTAHAQALWPTVRGALQQLQEAFAPQGFDAGHDERSFTLAMADATAALFVPALAAALQREQAQVRLRIAGLSTRDPRPMLEHGEADVAVGFFPDVRAALAAEGDAGLVCLESLYTCRYVCVMRHDHPLAAEGALSLDGFCGAQHLRVSFAGRPRGFVDEALARLGRERRVAITVGQFSTAGATVQRSDLLTVLPLSFVPAIGFASRLAVRPLPFDLLPIDVGMLWHRRHERDPAQRWLRDMLARVAAEVAADVVRAQ